MLKTERYISVNRRVHAIVNLWYYRFISVKLKGPTGTMAGKESPTTSSEQSEPQASFFVGDPKGYSAYGHRVALKTLTP